jgi:PKD repeat protein
MKTKIYVIALICLIGFIGKTSAQLCTASFTSSVNGSSLTVNNTSTGTSGGTSFVWIWGDNTNPGIGATQAPHTYASPGIYQVCLIIADSTTFCFSQFCDSIVILPIGVAENMSVENTLTVSPNPAAASANIHFTTNQSSDVTVTVFDMTGKQVAVLADEKMDKGNHDVSWTTEKAAQGVYFIQVKSGSAISTRRIVVTGAN